MPTKLGKGGTGQQNYDPNTGEYSNGSSFDSSLNDNINFIYSNEVINASKNLLDNEKEYIEKIFTEHITSEGINLLNEIGIPNIEKIDETSEYDRFTGIISLDKSAFEESEPGEASYETGEILLHESGHFVDHMLQQKIGKGMPAAYFSSTYVSDKYNDTLHNIVAKEKSKISRLEGFKIAIKYNHEFFNKFTNDENIKKINDFYLENVDGVIQEVAKQPEDFFNRYNFLQKKSDNLVFSKNAVYSRMREKIKENFPANDVEKYDDVLKKSSFYGRQKYSIVSDALSSRREFTQTRVCGMGHSASYYNQRLHYGLGAEFFANYFSAWSRNDIEQMEIAKKYLPKSCEVFDEIITKFKSKESIK